MPGQGSVYVRDISGNILTLDTSGRIQIAGSITASSSGTANATSGSVNSDLSLYAVSGGYSSGGQNLVVQIVSASGNLGVPQGTALMLTQPNQGGPGTGIVSIPAVSFEHGFNPLTNTWTRLQATASGDLNRLRTTDEGRAPTYTVTARNIGYSSGVSMVAPAIALFNYGSGTAVPAYKIKSLFIQPDPANTVASGGGPVSFDIIRFTGFSGGGTLLSGVAMDTSDPVYSGALAAPALMQKAYSGVVLDGLFFTYVTSNEGPYATASGFLLQDNTVFDPAGQQNTNLIQSRMIDTKQIVIRSGYGFGVVQSSGSNYTQVFSGTMNFSLTYSVEA